MPRYRKTGALALVSERTAEGETRIEAPTKGEPQGESRTVDKAAAGKAADVRALALRHGPEAIAALVKIINDGTSEAARIAAANALLDRAYGKARQGAAPVEPPEETRLTVMFV